MWCPELTKCNAKWHYTKNSYLPILLPFTYSIIYLYIRGHPHITSPPWGGGGVCKMMTYDDRGAVFPNDISWKSRLQGKKVTKITSKKNTQKITIITSNKPQNRGKFTDFFLENPDFKAKKSQKSRAKKHKTAKQQKPQNRGKITDFFRKSFVLKSQVETSDSQV